jgi:imidazolonepropionase-like amidohydrolase
MSTSLWRASVAVAALAVLEAALPAQAPERQTATVIRAGTLIDPEAGTATRDQSILIQNGRIAAIGATVSAPRDATIVDLSRAAVMPGLFDAHTHLCLDLNEQRDAGNYFHTVLHDPDTLRAIQGAVNARTMLEAGFTTVRDVGNEGNYACASVRAAIARGLIPGPTMQTAGRILAPYGGQFRLQPERPDIAGAEYLFADTRDEMVKGIRENIHFGSTVIKIVVDDQRYIYSTEDIRFMVEEAARAGAKLAAHVWTRQGAHNASLAGVASMEHLNGADEADLETARRNGTTAVFTPFPLTELERQRPKDVARQEFDAEIAQLKKGLRTGIPIAFGSDAITEAPGLTRGQTALTWIDSYGAAGMPPKALLKAMTSNAARLLGVDKERGTLAVGMAADIIATADNPFDNIATLKSVTFVMQNGRVVRSAGR